MSKAVVKYIPVDVYKRGIYVLIGSLKDLKYFVDREYTADEQTEFLEMVLNLKEENIGYASFNYDSEGGGIVLIPIEPKTPVEVAALVHELLHATFHILNYCRVEYCYDGNNEHFTYVLEWLTRNALNVDGYKEIENYDYH